MATIDSAVSIEELIHQCEIALEAIGQLNYTLMNLYQVPFGGSRFETFKGEVFEIIYTFLGSAGCISRILWPEAEGINKLCRGRITLAERQQANDSTSQGMGQRTLAATKKRFLKIFKHRCPSLVPLKEEVRKQLRDPPCLPYHRFTDCRYGVPFSVRSADLRSNHQRFSHGR